MRYYDKWAGNEIGFREDEARCVVAVADSTGFHSLQCRRKRGHGKDGLLCKQHAKMEESGSSLYIPKDNQDAK